MAEFVYIINDLLNQRTALKNEIKKKIPETFQNKMDWIALGLRCEGLQDFLDNLNNPEIMLHIQDDNDWKIYFHTFVEVNFPFSIDKYLEIN